MFTLWCPKRPFIKKDDVRDCDVIDRFFLLNNLIFFNTSHVTCHMSHVTCHMSHRFLKLHKNTSKGCSWCGKNKRLTLLVDLGIISAHTTFVWTSTTLLECWTMPLLTGRFLFLISGIWLFLDDIECWSKEHKTLLY